MEIQIVDLALFFSAQERECGYAADIEEAIC